MALGERGDAEIIPWNPKGLLKEVKLEEAIYSLGFLRARVARWFPGFAGHWISLMQSFDSITRSIDVISTLDVPSYLKNRVLFSVDGESGFVGIDDRTARIIADGMLPNSPHAAQKVLLEYLGRRFIGALGLTWSGASQAKFSFDGEGNFDLRWIGAIKLSLTIFGAQVDIWIGLTRALVDRVDSAWRRELRSARDNYSDHGEVTIEIGDVLFPPSQLGDYLRPGTAIDLEQKAGDNAKIFFSGEPVCEGALRIIGDRFGFECIQGYPSPVAIPDGTTRLAVSIAKVSSDRYRLGEISQVGSIIESDQIVGDNAELLINGEQVGSAVVCQLDGRFVVVVK